MNRTLIVGTAAPQFVHTAFQSAQGQPRAVLVKQGVAADWLLGAEVFRFSRMGLSSIGVIEALYRFRPDRILVVCGDLYCHDNVVFTLAVLSRVLGLDVRICVSMADKPIEELIDPLEGRSAWSALGQNLRLKAAFLLRAGLLAPRYPRGALVAFLQWFVYGKTNWSLELKPLEEDRVLYGDNVGYVSIRKQYVLRRGERRLGAVIVKDVEENNALNFFFYRKVSMQRGFQIARSLGMEMAPSRGWRIFEPGCNAGRNLFEFKHRYGAEVHGADVADVAIHVGRGVLPQDDLQVADLVMSDYLDQYRENEFDLVYVSDHFKHVLSLPADIDRYAAKLLHVGRRVLVVDVNREDVKTFLQDRGFTVVEDGKRVYAFCVSGS